MLSGDDFRAKWEESQAEWDEHQRLVREAADRIAAVSRANLKKASLHRGKKRKKKPGRPKKQRNKRRVGRPPKTEYQREVERVAKRLAKFDDKALKLEMRRRAGKIVVRRLSVEERHAQRKRMKDVWRERRAACQHTKLPLKRKIQGKGKGAWYCASCFKRVKALTAYDLMVIA